MIPATDFESIGPWVKTHILVSCLVELNVVVAREGGHCEAGYCDR